MYFDNLQSAKGPHSVRALSTVGGSDEDLSFEVFKRDKGINSQWEFAVCDSGNSKLWLCNNLEGWAGEGNGKPLQYSCLENPVDRGAWWAAVHRIAQSRTRLKRLSMHDALDKEMATQSSILAWRIPGTEEPGGQPSMGAYRVGHD